MKTQKLVSFLLVGLIFISGVSCQAASKKVRIGYFPNLTHAQALVGRQTGRFEKGMSGTELEWTVFNAGPSVIEAIFAGHLDIAYIGPGPAVNGFVKSNGEEIRVIAGAASGGAALVVREDSGIKSAQDFHGKKVASPQYGNTQDIALRAWLKNQGYKTKDLGGDVEVLPIANGDQLTLFEKKEIDASWTVEPWVSIFSSKAGAKMLLDEASLYPDGRYATTLVIVRKKFLKENPELVKEFLKVHRDITDWINQNPADAKNILNDHLEKLTHKRMDLSVLDSAFSRIEYTADVMKSSVEKQAQSAFAIGFIKKSPKLDGLFE